VVQRVEIITGKERRRRCSDDEKRRLMAEAFEPGAIRGAGGPTARSCGELLLQLAHAVS
jgi:transposase-like protein